MNLASLFRQHRRWLGIGALTLLLLLALSASVNAAQGDNGTCLGCHNNKDLSIKLASGEVLPLYVDPAVHNSSIHGMKGQTCVSCHTNISGYPHPKVTAGDRRSFQMERYTQCQTCHPEQYKGTLDSNHARALAGGNRNAAICTDCHGSHNVSDANSPRQKVSQACQKCHSKIPRAICRQRPRQSPRRHQQSRCAGLHRLPWRASPGRPDDHGVSAQVA